MKIVYVADLRRESTTYPRYVGLQEAGNVVVPFSATSICSHRNPFWNFVGHRYYCGWQCMLGNIRLLRFVRTERPGVVWIDKGRWIYPATLAKLHAEGVKLLHYNTDDIYDPNGYAWLHRLGIRHYDLYLTTNRFNVAEIPNRYGVRALRAGMGYDPQLHFPPANVPPGSDCPDVIFVGHWEPHTESYMAALADAGLRVRVYGGNWRRARRNAFRAACPLPQAEYIQAIKSAKIALCSLSRRNRNESTGRSFEIPAIGGCLVAESTAEHRYLYRDGTEAVLFNNQEHLVALCQKLVADESTRRSIAQRGWERCRSLGLSWQDHIRREWPLCVRMLTDSSASVRYEPKEDEPFWPGFRRGTPFEELNGDN